MTDLIEHWPAETVQLVLASRSDLPVRLYRLRMSGELCEIRDRDLAFSWLRAVTCWRTSVLRWVLMS
jgi:LuxR family transcriptional regulator, maltose regulon positive regulatory protein